MRLANDSKLRAMRARMPRMLRGFWRLGLIAALLTTGVVAAPVLTRTQAHVQAAALQCGNPYYDLKDTTIDDGFGIQIGTIRLWVDSCLTGYHTETKSSIGSTRLEAAVWVQENTYGTIHWVSMDDHVCNPSTDCNSWGFNVANMPSNATGWLEGYGCETDAYGNWCYNTPAFYNG